MAGASKTTGAVLVLGGGVAGIQCALDLAEGGYKVHLVDKAPALGGHMAQLDKTFPTNDCSMCTLSPKLVEVGRHLNVELVTNSELVGLTGEPGDFTATVHHNARFVDPDKCTSCGECVPVCPVTVKDRYNEELGERTAIYKLYPQAIPNTYVVDKKGYAPCKSACPVETSAQGYIALIAQGRFADAYRVAAEPNPFPSVCGRICAHPCETACSRGSVDEPISIASLKRFVCDVAGPQELPDELPVTYDERVAIVGAGPTGLSCARDLAKYGYATTVFEALPVAGGMLRVGIPDHRLPHDVLQKEIDQICALGVDLRLNQRAGTDFTVAGLLRDGYKAVFLATGLQTSAPAPVKGDDLDGCLKAVEFLRQLNLEDPMPVGDRVVVIGGGDVAFDTARGAARLTSVSGHAPDVTIAYRRTRTEMPASAEEIEEGLDERVAIEYLVAPVEIIGHDGKVSAVRLQRMRLGEPDERGRRRPEPIPGDFFEVPADTVIFAIGQAIVNDFAKRLKGVEIEDGAVVVDAETLATGRPGVFAGGDVAPTGPLTAIEAIAAGRKAAASIHNYLRGEKVVELWADPLPEARPADGVLAATPKRARVPMPEHDGAERRRSWVEVRKGYSEEQAIAEARRCLQCAVCSECMECVRACGPGALLHEERDREFEVKVGAVVMATGYDAYDPGATSEYGYRRYPNVMGALEYERMLSASGPTIGDVRRPSDGAHPRRVAFIQCVGSRDQKHDYCSSVCCMYATKEAMLTQDHLSDVQCDVLLMDVRAMGKGFDAFYQRALDRGVRYVRSRPSSIKEDPLTRNLFITLEDEAGELTTAEYDLVVLSVGLEPSRKTQDVAGELGIALNRHGFCQLEEFNPLETSREGVFATGPFTEPKDIPDSVAQASAAAALAMTRLADSRGTLVSEKEYPEERDVRGQEPRVGVFVCHCGSNIAGVVDVESVADYALKLPGVVYSTDTLYTCSSDSLDLIRDKIKELDLNRVVVASCTPRTHEPIFQDTLAEAGLNPFLFEMSNIRDQCSWVHAQWPHEATDKAKDLIRMSVARARLLDPLYKMDVPLTHAALVVGGGVAGMTAALALGEMGHEVHLVERTERLGGRVLDLDRTVRGGDPAAFVAELERRLIDNPRVHIHLEAELVDFHGFIGNFSSVIREADGKRTPVEHGVVLVATGAREERPELYGLGTSQKVVTQMDLERLFADGDGAGSALAQVKSVGMILCAGSLDENKPYCSRTCCLQAIKNAIRLKEQDPERPVYVWYKDVRTFGLSEEYYTKARELGVIFTRYANGSEPAVSANGSVTVACDEPALKKRIEVPVDLLVLATPTVPNEGNDELSQLLKVPLTADGFFLEAHVKLRPVDFASEGIFLCGSAHYPKSIDESISQAYAAAGRAASILAKATLKAGGVVAEVDSEKCAACLTCVRVCPYEVPVIDPGTKKAKIEAAACQGCGVCVAECPAKAITLHHYTDEQIFAKEEALKEESPHNIAAIAAGEMR
jgi:heterodisulfide reductase subunit A-like polyferredoxin